MSEHTREYVELTWRGRIICDREELRGGYCGSVDLELHTQQMDDDTSWVQRSHEGWASAAKHGFGRDDWIRRAETAEARVRKLETCLRTISGVGAEAGGRLTYSDDACLANYRRSDGGCDHCQRPGKETGMMCFRGEALEALATEGTPDSDA